MQLLQDVYAEYPRTIASGEDASTKRNSPDVAAIVNGLPSFLREALLAAGYDEKDYYIYGGIGQVPFNWAKIPWVAVCRRSITTSTTRGYYIVLLFKQDMTGCFLSLNQGFTQYKHAHGSQSIAEKQVARCAAACADYLNVGPPFLGGPIDLGATHDMGKGYQRGAIVSRYFSRTPVVAAEEFTAAFVDLLEMYGKLAGRVGGDILSFMPPVGEQIFQAEAGAIAEEVDLPPLPAGPLVPAEALGGSMRGRYKRDPKMAARALLAANFKCEVDPLHQTFLARRNKRTFVEAHHLFPMSLQPQFPSSLDVPENIIALCPNCHRLLHHATADLARPILKRLFNARCMALSARGIEGTLGQLFATYKDSLDEDD